ncbi:MAG: cbb3-type cytochrome c oxidase subunit I [Burkholderiaceae bacterium]
MLEPRYRTDVGALLDAGTRFALPVPVAERRGLAIGWLWLGVAALAGSGLFAILLVLARTPGLRAWFPVADFFRVALVIHVDLSVLVWFVACSGLLLNVAAPPRRPEAGVTALVLTSLGAACMLASPFVGTGAVVMSNYVPVLDRWLFLYGLALVAAGFAVDLLRYLAASVRATGLYDGDDSLRFGLLGAAVAGVLSLAALVWSWIETPPSLSASSYYEALFWGPGHVVQFAWTLLMLVAWLWLASASGARLALTPRIAALLLGVGAAAALVSPMIYASWPVFAPEHQRMFTWLMRFGGGLAILPIGLAVGLGLLIGERPTGSRCVLRSALLASMLLFAIGGAIGFLIRGDDVRVPAHYHGSIVGVTLAMMGIAYLLGPKLGKRPLPERLARWQIRLYAAGQLMHIAGLVWSGGYGVRRKAAGAAQSLDALSQIAGMGLMGAGGLLAIVGGLLFVLVMLRVLPMRESRAMDG